MVSMQTIQHLIILFFKLSEFESCLKRPSNSRENLYSKNISSYILQTKVPEKAAKITHGQCFSTSPTSGATLGGGMGRFWE